MPAMPPPAISGLLAPPQAAAFLAVPRAAITSWSRDLREVPVPLAHSLQPRRRDQADDLVGLAAQAGKRVGWADRHGEDQPARPAAADRAQGGGVGDAGRNPVVDDDHRAAVERHRCPVAAIGDHATAQLRGLAGDDRLERSVVDAQHRQRLGVEDPRAVLGDRADPVLGVVGSAELAHREDLQRGAQRRRHLFGHRHPTAGQADDDRFLVGQRQQPLGKPPPGVAAIVEAGDEHSTHVSAASGCIAESHRVDSLRFPRASHRGNPQNYVRLYPDARGLDAQRFAWVEEAYDSSATRAKAWSRLGRRRRAERDSPVNRRRSL